MAIMPGETYNASAILAEPVTPETAAAVERGDLRVYLLGRVEYEDVFRRSHTTTFGRYRFLFMDTWGWAHTEILNEMT
jgi:hypothetical protein